MPEWQHPVYRRLCHWGFPCIGNRGGRSWLAIGCVKKRLQNVRVEIEARKRSLEFTFNYVATVGRVNFIVFFACHWKQNECRMRSLRRFSIFWSGELPKNKLWPPVLCELFANEIAIVKYVMTKPKRIKPQLNWQWVPWNFSSAHKYARFVGAR